MQLAIYEKLGFLWKYGAEKTAHHKIGDHLLPMELVLSDPSIMRSFIENGCVGIDFQNMPEPVSVHLPFYDINIASGDPLHAAYSEQIIGEAITFASIRGIYSGVVHLGCNPKWPKKAFDNWYPTFLEAKERIEKKAEEQGFQVIWENTYEQKLDMFSRILSDHPNTKLCLDVGHVHCFSDFSVDDFIDRFGKNIVHLHLHNNFGDEDSHAALPKGDGEWRKAINRLGDMSVETVVLEMNAENVEKSETDIMWIIQQM